MLKVSFRDVFAKLDSVIAIVQFLRELVAKLDSYFEDAHRRVDDLEDELDELKLLLQVERRSDDPPA